MLVWAHGELSIKLSSKRFSVHSQLTLLPKQFWLTSSQANGQLRDKVRSASLLTIRAPWVRSQMVLLFTLLKRPTTKRSREPLKFLTKIFMRRTHKVILKFSSCRFIPIVSRVLWTQATSFSQLHQRNTQRLWSIKLVTALPIEEHWCMSSAITWENTGLLINWSLWKTQEELPMFKRPSKINDYEKLFMAFEKIDLLKSHD